tara:strand:- start:221 stop:583 length:363 start_codon:yes stop_codon:yes gene_type:complete
MRARSVFKASLATSNEVLYTVPSNTNTKWLMAFASNSAGSTTSNVIIKVRTTRKDTSNADVEQIVTVIGSKSLSAGEYLLLGSGNFTYLEAGDTIEGSAGAAGVGVILTLEETTGIVSTR